MAAASKGLEAFKAEFIAELKTYLAESSGEKIADLTQAKRTLATRAIPAIELAENINVLQSIIAFTLITHNIVVTQTSVTSRDAMTHYDERAKTRYLGTAWLHKHYNGRLGTKLKGFEEQLATHEARHPTHASTTTTGYGSTTEMGFPSVEKAVAAFITSNDVTALDPRKISVSFIHGMKHILILPLTNYAYEKHLFLATGYYSPLEEIATDTYDYNFYHCCLARSLVRYLQQHPQLTPEQQAKVCLTAYAINAIIPNSSVTSLYSHAQLTSKLMDPDTAKQSGSLGPILKAMLGKAFTEANVTDVVAGLLAAQSKRTGIPPVWINPAELCNPIYFTLKTKGGNGIDGFAVFFSSVAEPGAGDGYANTTHSGLGTPPPARTGAGGTPSPGK